MASTPQYLDISPPASSRSSAFELGHIQHSQIPHSQYSKIPSSHVEEDLGRNDHSTEGRQFANSRSGHGSIWRPGFWVRFPFRGVMSLVGVLACAAVGVYVLLASDGKPIDKWGKGITPSVYLAVTSIVANLFLMFALSEGLILAFWRIALKTSSLSELHYNWLCGRSFVDAVISGFRRGGRITALACILATLSVLRGPLNQRATSVESNVNYATNGTVQLDLAQILPEKYTGISLRSRAPIYQTARLQPVFNKIMQEYTLRSNMTVDHSPCGRECSATIKGFGFKPDCRIEHPIIKTNISGAWNTTVFNITVGLYNISKVNYTWENFNAGLIVNATFRANNETEKMYDQKASIYTRSLTSHVCKLVGGIVSYRVKLRNGTVTFAKDDWRDDRFLEPVNLTSPSRLGIDSTIGGFQYAGNYLFSSSAYYYFGGAVSSAELTGATANQFLVNGSALDDQLRFNDPMDFMLNSFREMAFRTALRAGRDNATGTNATQQVPFDGIESHTVYVTDTIYMISAAIVSIVGVVAVSLTYHGWWELGREVSMSPFEIAKAFDTPLFRDRGSNFTYRKYLKEFGGQKVMYGEDERGQLRLGKVEEVRSPKAGLRY